MIGFDPCDCIVDCIGSIICDYLCCCCCAPSSPGDEVKDGAVDGLIETLAREAPLVAEFSTRTVFLQNAQRYLALHYSRNQLATPRRWLPHVTASYTLNAAGKRRIGKRNNAVLRNYYDVVAMTPDVVALRPKPSTNATWEEDLAAARRGPC